MAHLYTTYIAFWGVKNATDPTFYGNQKQPLKTFNFGSFKEPTQGVAAGAT